ncbi:hypothetical protein Y032_0235g3192 [Ancylostoma ceylanicum]|uniref:Uncharacterized protein n=1 Tax=Ancylostoma ceylanicum TaxID=53326 RepID=A0A016SFU5_9BILA|nr:hypothetical protein Y032_0235g3192 [Ancylostoma ceylanicum]
MKTDLKSASRAAYGNIHLATKGDTDQVSFRALIFYRKSLCLSRSQFRRLIHPSSELSHVVPSSSFEECLCE